MTINQIIIKQASSSSMALYQLELAVFLGWPDSERLTQQTILLDIKIEFATPPLACVTDNLVDTVCYDTLVNNLKSMITTRHFRLVEYLGQEIYDFLKKNFSNNLISLRIHKKPPIIDLLGGVTFCYGDMAW